MGWQWYQLDHVQVICTSLQTDNHASTSPLSFYRPDALHDTQSAASKHWRHKSTSNNCSVFTHRFLWLSRHKYLVLSVRVELSPTEWTWVGCTAWRWVPAAEVGEGQTHWTAAAYQTTSLHRRTLSSLPPIMTITVTLSSLQLHSTTFRWSIPHYCPIKVKSKDTNLHQNEILILTLTQT